MSLDLPQVTTIFSLPVLGIGLGLAASWLIGSFMVRWRKYPAFSAAVAPACDFILSTPDGLSLAATFWPGAKPNSPGVLLMHGLGDSRQAVAANAEWFAKQGFAVVTIDFRGHGQSSPAPHSFGLNESIDAQTAFEWLKSRQQGAPVGAAFRSAARRRSWAKADRFASTRLCFKQCIPTSGARSATGLQPMFRGPSPMSWNRC
ncbi:MAG: alpha/beta hydrolase [Rhodoblastus sp.]|uniref:alpha/beta hydrolase n=1 Tax=Rhodoblastus sp. TaxID=1962975 RepID=UPI003F9C87AD